MSLKLYYHFGFSCLLANCVLFRAMARLDQDIMRKNVKGTYILKKLSFNTDIASSRYYRQWKLQFL